MLQFVEDTINTLAAHLSSFVINFDLFLHFFGKSSAKTEKSFGVAVVIENGIFEATRHNVQTNTESVQCLSIKYPQSNLHT